MKWMIDDDGSRLYVHIREAEPCWLRSLHPLVAAVYVKDFAFRKKESLPTDEEVAEMHKTAQAIVDAHNAAEATSGNP